MKKLSLINLHKVEIKKNMLAQIKGGIDNRCACTLDNPLVSTKQSGGGVSLCACGNSQDSSVSAQTKTSM